LDNEQHYITQVALLNFDTDIRFIEEFVSGIGDTALKSTFVELRQVPLISFIFILLELIIPMILSC
jgi:hypothetical protein